MEVVLVWEEGGGEILGAEEGMLGMTALEVDMGFADAGSTVEVEQEEIWVVSFFDDGLIVGVVVLLVGEVRDDGWAVDEVVP